MQVPQNDIVRGIVSNVTADIASRMKQEIMGESEQKLKQVLQQFKSRVARIAYQASQKWCKWSDEGPVMMPDFTRTYYRKGNTEVMLMEFPPQQRLVKLRNSLCGEKGKDTAYLPHDSGVKGFTLALPYVDFIFKFVDGMFYEVYVFFSNKPITKATQKPSKPYLSNVDNNFKVCLGRDFKTEELKRGNLTQQVAYVLFHFWNTIYSDEWSTNWWMYRDHFANDPNLADPKKWQEATTADPLFVIDVDWVEHNDEIGDMIVRLFEGDAHLSSFQQELFAQASDAVIDNFEQEVSKLLGTIAQKINLDTHVQALTKAIENA